MELVYLYVQRFGQSSKVKKGAFAFSPNYDFVHDDRSRTRFSLKITRREAVPSNFFPPHIANISFIVGRNGTGKTITLELLRYVLSLKDERTHRMGGATAWSRYLVVFKDPGGKLLAFSTLDYRAFGSYHHKRVACTLDGEPVDVHELMEQGVFHKTWHLGEMPESYPSIAPVSYSPLFNLRDLPLRFDEPGYFDVTSNFLVQVDSSAERIENVLLAHRRGDVRRGLQFINSALRYRGRWPRRLVERFIPRELSVQVHTVVLSKPETEMRYMGLDAMGAHGQLKLHYVKYRASLVLAFRESKKKNEERDLQRRLFRMEMLVAALDGLYGVIEHRGSGYTSPNDFLFNLVSGSFDIAPDAGEEPFVEFLRRQTAIPQQAIEKWLEQLAQVEGSARLTDHGDLTFEFPLRKGPVLLELDSLLRAAERTDEYRPLLTFDWSDMSSGQKMMLDMFSRLYYADRAIVGQRRKYETITLLLDEPEVGFHPTWQRGWLAELMAFTKGLKGAEQFQFIIATNNPLSLSDVPGDCVEYMGGRAIEPHTFAANIHELLGDSFYLQEGFIGEFAKDKLESLIRYLASPKIRRSRTWNEDSAWKGITMVGDRVIRERLKDMYYRKYPEKLPSSENEKERLRRLLAAMEAGDAQ